MPVTIERGRQDRFSGLLSVERELWCKAEEPPTNPDVAVDILDTENETWTRIPTTEVEVEETKDGPAAITTTARVEFPAEWGGDDILQYINGYQSLKSDVEFEEGEEISPETVEPEDVYDICRIWFRDQESGVWVVKHYGYIGGVGPSTNNGIFKFYVYDPADLLRGVSVSKSFETPNAEDMVRFVLFGTDDRGEQVGLTDRTVFDNANSTIIKNPDEQLIADKATFGGAAITTVTDLFISEGDNIFSSLLTEPTDTFDDAADFLFGGEDEEEGEGFVRGALEGDKNFKSNRHNMADVLNWFTTQIGAQWFFDPTAGMPIFVIDATNDGPPRREFADTELTDSVESYSGKGFGNINVLNNTAIADIKPINRVTVNGEGTSARPQDDELNNLPVYSRQYPTATATYKPLLKRAGGYKYGPTDVNTNAQSMNAAEGDAIDELRQHLSEATDGDIELTGDPFIKPFDYLTIIPVCNDVFPNADANPITFEVNTTRHIKNATGRYKTECDVSFVFDESEVNVTSTLKEL